jgi:hypothetical protein
MPSTIKRKPKRVSVLELGAGHEPHGVIGQAKKALRKRFGRRFEASDEYARVESTFRAMGLSKLPHNAKIMKQCSIEHLKNAKPGSFDVIYSSFFIRNQLHQFGNNTTRWESEFVKFFKLAARAMKPGGRLVLLEEYIDNVKHADLAKRAGLKTHIVEPNEERLSLQDSEWVNMRLLRANRKNYLEHFLGNGTVTQQEVEKTMRAYGLKHPEDIYLPSFLIARK